jgi:hypothetical protein
MQLQIDRETFVRALGGEAVAATLSSEAKADALDDYLLGVLNSPEYPVLLEQSRPTPANGPTIRRGTGATFGDGQQTPPALVPLPEQPSLLDYFRLRLPLPFMRHLLQSAGNALAGGATEEQVLACLLHDFGQTLARVDHGWWGAQMIEPYVSEEVAFAVRYHQALRFYADESVGYHYPELYVQIFGENYVPEPYIAQTYERVRQHRWYMAARMVTVHDLYAFDPDTAVSLDPFIDIIGRNFRQPAEGLGFDRSPVAHMWRSLSFPDHPL